MPAGYPVKVNYLTGDVLTAADLNDLAGTVNLYDPTAKGDLFPATAADAVSRLAVGANDTVLTADSTAATGMKWAAAGGGGAVNSNKVINGNFAINQRLYASGATLASGVYGLDRWKSNAAGTTLTFTAAVNGNELTINSTGGIQQVVERQVIPAGNNTLSWEGTATARMYNSGASAPSYAASPITVNLDGLANVVVEFTAAGGTRTVSNVKLEAGTTASAFVLAGNTAEGELAACLRYFWRVPQDFHAFAGFANSSTVAAVVAVFPVTMRVNPSAVANATGFTVLQTGNSANSSTAAALNNSGVGNIQYYITVASGLTAGQGVTVRVAAGTGPSTFSAEL